MKEDTEKEFVGENGTTTDEAGSEQGGSGQVSTDDGASAALSETESLQQIIEQLKEQLLRKAAEFENFRRRSREEQSALIKYGNEGLILELLPVLDDFERSMKHGREHPDFDTFYKGMELISSKLTRILEHRGLSPIDVNGRQFDVNFHDALLQIPNAEVESGTIIDEVERGYMFHDKVLRHSKVTVATEPPPPTDGD